MTQRRNPVRDERGQGGLVLGVVLIVVLVAVLLLVRTQALAVSVHKKTANIAKTGRGISDATDAVLQLNNTNQYGKNILDTSKPLAGQVTRITEIARSIDGLATSINATAGDINGTAHGINSTAARILTTANSIKAGVVTINHSVDNAIAIVRKIQSDTDNVLKQADVAHKELGCIDRALAKADDAHCR